MRSRHLGHLMCGSAAAVALLVTGSSALAQQSTNAQSLSFNLTSPQDFVIDMTTVYAYNTDTAKEYFTTVVSGPVITCTPTARPLCQAGSQPATPDQPPALESKLDPLLTSNRCTFFSGGALSAADAGNPYKQSVQISLGSGMTRVNWVFEWTYTIQTVGSPVAALTAWDEVETTVEGEVPAEVSGWLAGQSTQLRTGRNGRFKTSHTLMTGGAPRLENGKISLFQLPDVTNPIAEVDLQYPFDFSVNQNEDFYYRTTPGSTFNSPPGLLVLEGYVDDIQNGLVAANGTLDGNSVFDDFAGNNNTGGERIVFGDENSMASGPLPLLDGDGNPVTLTEAGNYRYVLSGTLKGNAGEAAANFSGSENVTILGDGCS